MSLNNVGTQGPDAILQAFRERLQEFDMAQVEAAYPDPKELVSRMVTTLPDLFVDDPMIGTCYSTARLAAWKGLSRQGIAHQQRTGRLLGVKHGRTIAFPSVQFDVRGRMTRPFRKLLEEKREAGLTDMEIALCLETPDADTGITPRQQLLDAPDTRTAAEKWTDDFDPVLITDAEVEEMLRQEGRGSGNGESLSPFEKL